MREQGRKRVNLTYAHKLLVAADQQPHGSLKIRGREAEHEVPLMVDAGLVDAPLSDGTDASFTAIIRLTDLGKTFLRTFKGHPIPALTKRMAGGWDLGPWGRIESRI